MTGVPAGIIVYRGFSHWVMAPKIREKPDQTEPDCGWMAEGYRSWTSGNEYCRIFGWVEGDEIYPIL